MWTRQRRLALLHQELASIDMLDRLREYAAEPDRTDYGRESCRQRRAQILAEIAQLNVQRPQSEARARRISATLLFCATVYATFYFFLK